MPQPHTPDPDPLLAFAEEYENNTEPTVATTDPAPDRLRNRVESLERQVEHALSELTAVKSDLATLVSAVDEIKGRLSQPRHRRGPVIALPPGTRVRMRMVAAVVAVITIGAAMWTLAAAMSYDVPEPPRIESRSSQILAVPPIIEAQPPDVAPAAFAPLAPSPAVSTRRTVNYVGSLTIDAEPGGTVFLNRKSVGRTPLRLDSLRAGSHLIWIEREGYRRWTRVVPVAADRISRISASLDPVQR